MHKLNISQKRFLLIPGFEVFFLFILGIACCAQPGSNGNPAESASETSPATQFTNINVQQFDDLRAKTTDCIVLDVRTSGETANGVVPGAIEIDFAGGGGFDEKIAGLQKEKTYLVYCQAGGRSARAAQVFVDNGFSKVYNLEGGFGKWSEIHQKDDQKND